MPNVLWKCIVIWCAFIPVAILNGFLRETYLVPLVGARLALPLSGVSCAVLFLVLVWFTLPWLGLLPANRYRIIGFAWLVMTVLFEFFFGRLVAHKSWDELLRAYDVTTGNLWPIVLLVVTITPWLIARRRGMIS